MKKKSIYILIAVLCFMICILILKLFSNHQFIRGFIGDVAITILIFSFIKIFKDINSFKLSLFVLTISYFTEFMQYLRLINHIGLGENRLAQIIIGTTFDYRDLIAYTIGVIIAFLIDVRISNKER